jgi:GntR family transcriptional regulator
MNYITISRYQPTPLYAQLKQSILNALSDGTLKPGDKLPTEEELCERFAISRPVVRQAYSELISEGIISRVKGKGSFIREKEIQSHFFQELSTFDDEMKRVGMTPSTKVISKEIIKDKKFQDLLQLGPQDDVLHIRFLYLGNNIPMVISDTYVPCVYFPDLINKDLDKRPLYHIFESDYNRYIVMARRTFDAIIVSDQGAGLLKVAKGSAIYEVKTIATDMDDRILEYSRAGYPGERNSFDIMIYKHQP